MDLRDSKPPSREPVATLEEQPDAAGSIALAFGLSKAELHKVIKAMLGAVSRAGCPKHVHPFEVVNDAFITAAAKPSSEVASIIERKKFVPWMCTLAEYAAMTNRNSRRRRLLGEGHSDVEMDGLLSVSGDEERIAAREALRKAWPLLEPADQEILAAHYFDGKTIQKIALEQKLRLSTVESRYRRALRNLRYFLQSLIAAIILFVTKNVRAQSARLAQQAPRWLAHTLHTACAMTVMVACGVLVPAGSAGSVVSQGYTAFVPSPPNAALAAAMVPTEPPLITLVKQSKPIVVDMPEKQCSARRMRTNKIIGYLQGTVLPFAFLVAPAVTQLDCAGTEQHTPPPQEPEERDDSMDPYDGMCLQERRRGNDCPTKAEWYKQRGWCPDGTRDCQKK